MPEETLLSLPLSHCRRVRIIGAASSYKESGRLPTREDGKCLREKVSSSPSLGFPRDDVAIKLHR